MLPNKLFVMVSTAIVSGLLTACTSAPQVKPTKPNSEKAQLNLQLGARYLELGMLQEAKQKLDKAVELDGNNADIHNALAVLAQRIEQPAEARQHFSKALSLKPNDVGIQNNYGSFLCQKGDFNEGMTLLQQAAATPLNQHQWFAHTNIGRCYLTRHQAKEAELAFRQALQLKPDYAPALMEMQKLSFENDQYFSARAFLERYLAVAEHTAQTLWIGMQTEQVLDNNELAERYRQQLLTRFPASEQAQQLRASSHR